MDGVMYSLVTAVNNTTSNSIIITNNTVPHI